LAGALARVHAVGGSRFRPVHDRRHGQDQPLPLRSARGRVGDHRRAHGRVLGLQVRAVLPGRVSEHVRDQRGWALRYSWAGGASPSRRWRGCRPTAGSRSSCSGASRCSSGCAARCRGCVRTSSWASPGSSCCPCRWSRWVAAALWHATSGWQFAGAGLVRWVLGGAAILLPYQWLSRA